MAKETYRVLCEGTVDSGKQLVEVKDRLPRAFRVEASSLSPFFQGTPVVIKFGLHHVTAQKYVALFRQAGAGCGLEREPEGAPPLTEVESKTIGQRGMDTERSPAHTTNAPTQPSNQAEGKDVHSALFHICGERLIFHRRNGVAVSSQGDLPHPADAAWCLHGWDRLSTPLSCSP